MPETAPLETNAKPATGAEAGSGDLASDLMTELTAPVAPAPEPAPAGDKPVPAAPAAKAPEGDKAKPTPDKAKPAPAAPAPKAPAAKSAPAPQAINVDDPKLTAPELRKHLKQLQTDLQQTRTEKETTVGQLQTKLRDLEGKRFWSEDDEKSHQNLTERLAQLEANLYGRNYADSPEYKKLYTDKINEKAQDALDVFKSLPVKFMDGEEEKTREGNWNDVLRIYNAPNNAERRKLAKQLFGEDFQEALDVVNPMVDIRKAADAAVKEKAENYQTESKAQAEKIRDTQTQVQQFIRQQSESLAQKFPDIFAAGEDNPDAAAALKKGFDFVDESTRKQDLNINERAARAALIRSWAGAFPRLVMDVNRLKARNTELEAEIAKYHASDPGNGGDGGGGGGDKGGKDGGSDDLAAEITKLGGG